MPVAKLLRKLDLFGEQFHFSLHGEETTKTLVGAFFTILFYAGLLTSAGWFILEFLDTTSPEIKVSVSVEETSVSHSLYNQGIYFLFMLRNGNNFIPTSQISTLASMSFSLVSGSSVKSLPVAPCSRAAWFSTYKQSLFHSNEALNFEKFSFCPEIPEGGISTMFNPDTQESVEFRLDITQLASVAPASLAEVFLEQFTLQTFMNISSVEAPLELYRDRLKPVRVSPGITKKHFHELKTVRAVTRGGILGEETQSGNGAAIHKSSEDTIATATNEMISLRIMSGLNTETNNRDYVTWFSLTSNIGGISELGAFLVTFIYSAINAYVAKKNLIRFGVMRKEETTNLLENVGNPKDPEFHDYNDTMRLRLINSKIMKPKDEREASRAEFFKECESLALERCDIYKIIKNFGELIFLKSIFFTEAHRKLAPIVGLSLMEEMEQEVRAKNSISVTEAINLLSDSPEGTSELHKEVSREFREILNKQGALKMLESTPSKPDEQKLIPAKENGDGKELSVQEKENSPREDLSDSEGQKSSQEGYHDKKPDDAPTAKVQVRLPIRMDSGSPRKE